MVLSVKGTARYQRRACHRRGQTGRRCSSNMHAFSTRRWATHNHKPRRKHCERSGITSSTIGINRKERRNGRNSGSGNKTETTFQRTSPSQNQGAPGNGEGRRVRVNLTNVKCFIGNIPDNGDELHFGAWRRTQLIDCERDRSKRTGQRFSSWMNHRHRRVSVDRIEVDVDTMAFRDILRATALM